MLHARVTDPKPMLEPWRVGDKVRVKRGRCSGCRGLVARLYGHKTNVVLADGGRVTALTEDLTNYSAAARLAWRTMPKKAGRPAGARPKTRVSLRIDSEVWTRLGELANAGAFQSRESLVNTLLRQTSQRLGSREGVRSHVLPFKKTPLAVGSRNETGKEQEPTRDRSPRRRTRQVVGNLNATAR